MGDAHLGLSEIDRYVATNVRFFREERGISQDELAQRMGERGFGFTQATIWKIESGQRQVKIGEAVALGSALELLTWTSLTNEPEASRYWNRLDTANRRAHHAYKTLKAAAAQYLEEQVGVQIAVYEARKAGLDTDMWEGWLTHPAERAVIEARVEADQEGSIAEQQDEQVEAALQALHRADYFKPPRPEDVVSSLDE